MQTQENETKMSRETFQEELCSCVLELLGSEYSTELSRVKKNNGVRKEVLYVRKRDYECIPCFYMDELYHSYCLGENEVSLAEHMVNVVKGECEQVRKQAKQFLKKEWITNHLFLRLVHYEKNKEELEEAVFQRFLDLACVVYVMTENSEDGVKSFRLPKYIWETLELGTFEAYFPELLANTQRLFPKRIECISRELSRYEAREDGDLSWVLEPIGEQEKLLPERLYVLSNQRRINGAAVILYADLLKQLGERFGGDFYMIPSSIHEVLLVKETGGERAEEFNRLIRNVNETQVMPEEILSDHVYYYSVKNGCVCSK